jgi:hypothetical protein
LINNRQGGRRRGRGGQRGQNVGSGQPGNRQDNRQRGNAAQLLEKYKAMARDSQLAGDRVQTEYYLQFADHYFRVLSESRARFEEQNPRRQRDDELDEDEGDDEGMDAQGDGADDWQQERQDSQDRPERGERQERQGRQERSDRQDREDRPERGERAERSARRPRPRRDGDEDRGSRDSGNGEARANGGETIPFDVLPPAIGRDPIDVEEAAEERRPRRRARTARPADGDGEIAPAA